MFYSNVRLHLVPAVLSSPGTSDSSWIYPLTYSAVLHAEIPDAWMAEHKLRLDLAQVSHDSVTNLCGELERLLRSRSDFAPYPKKCFRSTCQVKRDSTLLFEKRGERIFLTLVIAAHRMVECEAEVPPSQGEMLQAYKAHIAADLTIELLQATLSALSVAPRRFVFNYTEAEGRVQEVTECRIEPV